MSDILKLTSSKSGSWDNFTPEALAVMSNQIDADLTLNRAMERERESWYRATGGKPGIAVTLEPLTAGDAERIRQWRNLDLSGLRTPYPLTEHQQRQWYEQVVSDRDGPHRYWGVKARADDMLTTLGGNEPMYGWLLVGMVGLTFIDWYNRHAEIALVTDPARRRQGIGRAAVLAVLREGFENLGLHHVYGECYHCNPALGFWQRLIADYGWQSVELPARKRWAGQWHDSTYFAIMGVPR